MGIGNRKPTAPDECRPNVSQSSGHLGPVTAVNVQSHSDIVRRIGRQLSLQMGCIRVLTKLVDLRIVKRCVLAEIYKSGFPAHIRVDPVASASR